VDSGHQSHLRPYQQQVVDAVQASRRADLGDTITVQIARRGGKNELSASLEVDILREEKARGGEMVKCAPTFAPQCRISIRRLRQRARQCRVEDLKWMDGNSAQLGAARLTFLSADQGASVVGHTASLLLEADEAQAIDVDAFDRDFRPMTATTNATVVLYGTPWDDFSLLERAKQHNLELERRDGRRRHFEFDWTVVAEYNPRYGAFVEKERDRLGPDHPTFLTQYCLRTLSGGGRLFSPETLARMAGKHPRFEQGVPGRLYVAGLDVGGQDLWPLGTRVRDATVLTIAEVPAWDARLEPGPTLRIVAHRRWVGVDHESLAADLVDLAVRRWPLRRLVVDATGLGETLAGMLQRRLAGVEVVPFRFSAESKSRLGYELMAAANGGHIHMYAEACDDHAAFWRELRMARVSYGHGGVLGFSVDERDGHDDYLMSLALTVRAAADSSMRTARGRR
jgi:hypothetical protein